VAWADVIHKVLHRIRRAGFDNGRSEVAGLALCRVFDHLLAVPWFREYRSSTFFTKNVLWCPLMSSGVHSCHIHISRNAVAAKTHGIIGAMRRICSVLTGRDIVRFQRACPSHAPGQNEHVLRTKGGGVFHFSKLMVSDEKPRGSRQFCRRKTRRGVGRALLGALPARPSETGSKRCSIWRPVISLSPQSAVVSNSNQNRQNRRARRFSTDSTTPYQVLTTNQNRRTPIFVRPTFRLSAPSQAPIPSSLPTIARAGAALLTLEPNPILSRLCER